MDTQENRNQTAQLLEEAAEEIEQLRLMNGTLKMYRDHTERMLALFEGGPRDKIQQGFSVDVLWKLRQAAEGFREAAGGQKG